jgi:hypothetical protein
VKGYFYLLAVLFAASVLTRGISLFLVEDLLTQLRYMADIVLFGLCLKGCFGMAFGRTYHSPPVWRLIAHLTLALGGFTLVLGILGPDLGRSPHSPTDPISLGFSVLPYVLFAIPAILYGHSLKHPPKD